MWGTQWRSRKVAGSIPDGVIGIFHWYNPSRRTLALELTQTLTEISTRNISWGLDVFLTVHHELTMCINYQLWYTDYYLFIKYYSHLHASSLKCSSSGGYSCTHAAYGTVTLYERSWWPVGTQLEWELTVGGRLLVGVLRHRNKYQEYFLGTWCFSDRASWIDYVY